MSRSILVSIGATAAGILLGLWLIGGLVSNQSVPYQAYAQQSSSDHGGSMMHQVANERDDDNHRHMHGNRNSPGMGSGMMRGPGMMGGGMMAGPRMRHRMMRGPSMMGRMSRGMMGPGMMGMGMMGPGMMMGSHGMMGPMMGYNMSTHWRNLSEDQRSKLQSMHEEMRSKQEDRMRAMQQARLDLASAMIRKNPDQETVGKAFDKLSSIRREMLLNCVRMRGRIQDVLKK